MAALFLNDFFGIRIEKYYGAIIMKAICCAVDILEDSKGKRGEIKMENVAMVVGAVVGIAILLFLHYKKSMKWKWSVILGYVGFSLVMTLLYTAMGKGISSFSDVIALFFLWIAIPVLALLVVFFVIGFIMNALGISGGSKKSNETELERMQREQMIRESNEKYRPRL